MKRKLLFVFLVLSVVLISRQSLFAITNNEIADMALTTSVALRIQLK